MSDNKQENSLANGECRLLDWSIIVPAYNEEFRLGSTLSAIDFYMKAREGSFELLVVDDGSVDGTVDLVKNEFPSVRLISNPGNRGKGYSVRVGLQAAKGKYLLFSDADLSTPIEEIEKCEEKMRAGADVVIASRALTDSIIEKHQVWWRELSGRVFNMLVRVISGLPFVDTQCGFKAYTAEAGRRIASHQRIDGWAFDVEQLRLAARMGFDVQEIPVHWVNSDASRLSFFRDAPLMFWELVKIRLMRYKI